MSEFKMDSKKERIDVEKAIWDKNFPLFKEALDTGWQPISIDSHSSGLNVLLVSRIISLNWDEGFKALVDKVPNILSNEIFFKLSVKTGNVKLVELFLNSPNFSPHSKVSNDFGGTYTVTEFIIKELARIGDVGYVKSEEDYFDLLLILKNKFNVNLMKPIIGGNGKIKGSPTGHCAWTFALLNNKLFIASQLLPKTWDEVKKSPMAIDTIFKFLENFQIRKNYVDEEVVESNSFDDEEINVFWANFLNQYLMDWMKDGFDYNFNQVVPYKVYPYLTKEVRGFIWDYWKQSSEDGWSLFHDLAKEALLKSSFKVICLMIQDRAEVLSLWKIRPDGEGVSPSFVWHLQCGEDMTEEQKFESVELTVDEAIQEILEEFPYIKKGL